MKIIVADDERLALKAIVETIKQVLPDAEIFPFQKTKELIELAFQKDGVKREAEAQPHNWVKDIRAELRAKK